MLRLKAVEEVVVRRHILLLLLFIIIIMDEDSKDHQARSRLSNSVPRRTLSKGAHRSVSRRHISILNPFM